MSAASLKATLRAVSIAGAMLGAFLLIYVGRVIAGVSEAPFSSIHPFIAFYGGYLIYQSVVFQRKFSSQFVHEFLGAIMCPIGLVACVGIMSSEFSTTLIRAVVAISSFLSIGVIYKALLGYSGRVLFGKEIIE